MNENSLKQIFIEVNEDEIFKDIIDKLEEKYNWLKINENKKYYFNNIIINKNKSIKNLNIKNNDNIMIII